MVFPILFYYYYDYPHLTLVLKLSLGSLSFLKLLKLSTYNSTVFKDAVNVVVNQGDYFCFLLRVNQD